MFNTAFQSFEYLIVNNIMPVSNGKEWQPFRETYLYTVDVNDVLETNLDLIQKIYNIYTKPNKKYMSLEDAIDLFFKKSDCGMNYKEITYCYGMSKMTVQNENDESQKYLRL